MADKLVIVESPTKARTISRYLGKGYAVKACGGHVRDLPERDYGVDLEHGFEPTYTVLPRRARTVAGLKKSSAKASVVYLAPDPDREGEAIAWHLKHALGLPDEKVRRAVFHEITRGAVRRAFEQTRSLDMDLVNAQQARRVLDRIVGYELSPLISRKIIRGLSAGRVQSVALRLVCERELEVRAFEPEEYWKITARLRREAGAEEFEAEFKKLDGEEVTVSSEGEARELVEKLQPERFRVSRVETRKRTSRPSPPFITSTLQQAAGGRLRLTTAQTMRIAQQLYEGIEIAGRSDGLITYMRTDSTRVSQQALKAVRGLIEERYGREYLPEKPHFFKSPKRAQAAHEAIRPTDVSRTPDSIAQYLSDEQRKLYELIWRRFVASQTKPALYEVTTVEIEAGPALFGVGGRRTLFDGYTRVMPPTGEQAKELPLLTEGDVLELLELLPSQHFTQPPPRYSEASLVRELERRGIGRPSTYAPTISTLLRRNYVRRLRRTLHATDLGLVVTKMLVEHFPRELDYDFTRDLEEKLDTIEGGKVDWREIVGEFYRQFSLDLERARTEMKPTYGEEFAQGRTCEKCGKEMLARLSRKGDMFLGCSGFPECDHTVPLSSGEAEEPKETEHKCPKCGSPMLLKTGRKGRPYLACSAYPECRKIMGLDREGKPVEFKPRAGARAAVSIEEALSQSEDPARGADPCEQCGSAMVLKKSKKGHFLGCSGYPECRGTRPLKAPDPVPTHECCEKCARPLVLRWGRYGRFLACSGFPRCKNTWRLPASMPPCPQPDCGGHLIRKLSREGKELYGCTRLPECDYTCQKLPRKKK